MPKQAPGILPTAIKLLARREHSRVELRQKLGRQGKFNSKQIDEALTKLVQSGYLSDRRFAEQFVGSRLRRWGRRRIEYELAQRGIDKALILDVLANVDEDDEVARTLAVLRQKNPEPLVARSKQELRCRRFLTGRGFSAKAISRAIDAHRA